MSIPTKNKETIYTMLAKRLKMLGFILIAFGFISFGFALFSETEADADEEEEVVATDVSDPNYYLITTVFALVGTSLIFIAWRRSRLKTQ